LAHDDPVSVLAGQAVLVTTFVEGKRATGSAGTLRSLGDLLGRMHTLAPGPAATLRVAGSMHHLASTEGPPSADIRAAMPARATSEGTTTPNRKDLHAALAGKAPELDGFPKPPPA